MHLPVLFLLPLVAAAPFYEIHGHLPSIRPDDLAPESYDRHDETLRSHLQYLLSSKFVSSVIDKIRIHGEEVGKPTAIFYAYLETTEKVEAVTLQKSKEMELFFFRERREEEEEDASPSGKHWLEMMKRTKRAERVESGTDATVTCVNGGLALPNNTCACPAFYTGSTCQTQICLNGGILDANRCACPPGHYSVNCEPRGCLPAVQDKFDNTKQTFILVLNQRSTMSYVLNNVIVGMPSLLQTINYAQQNLIDNYILVNYGYTSTGAYYMNQKYADNQADFLSYVQGVTAIDGPAQQYTNWALYSAQNFDPFMHGFSNIFIFSDATDINGGAPQYIVSTKGDEVKAITQTIAWRNRPVYLLSQMKGMPIPSDGSDYATYRRVAAATLGDIITFDMLEINDILTKVLPSYLQNENIAITYQSTVSSLLIPPGDTANITILVTVDPNAAVPDVSHSAGATVISSGARYTLLSAGNTFGFLNVTSTTPYSARVWVNSGNTALLGYSTDPLIDIGSSYIPAELVPYVSAGPIGWTGAVSYALVDNTGKITVPMASNTAVPRTSVGECSFSLSFGPFTSTLLPGNQMVHLTLGNAIRIVPGFAGQLDHHTAIPFNCFNNGTRTGPSTCQCPDQFEGSNCADPVCYYGGKVNPFPGNGNPLCLCPTGYSGDHCDQLKCPIVPGPQYPFSSQRSIAFVIQNSMSQAWVNANMYKGLTNMLVGLTGNNQFVEYFQTTFNNIIRNGQNYTQILSHSTSDQSDFLYSMESDNIQYMATSTSTQDSLGALYKTIDLIDNDKSSIFLFLDSAPQSSLSENDIIDAAVSRQLEINIVITPPYAMPVLCMSTGDAGIYREIAQKTGGIYLNLCNRYGNYSNDPVVQFLTAYGASHHHTENLNEALAVGPNTVSIDFKVDNPTDEVYGFVNCEEGESFTATLTNKDTAESVPLMSMADMPFVGIYRITPAFVNTAGYTLSTTTTTGYCSVRVAEKTLNALYLGFSQNPAQDFKATTLLYGVPTSPVAHPYAGSYLINASSISLTVATDDGNVLYQSNGIKRSNCEFDFYFNVPFVCQQLYSTFVFTSTMVTVAGTFQRTQRGFCYQPQKTCLNGGTYDADDYRCICVNNWSGDFCETPVCQNSGTVKNFACSCPNVYTGQFCQYGSCQQWNFMETNDVRQINYKQITFVMNRNKGQLLVNIMMEDVLKNLLHNGASMNPTQFSLIQFDENGYYDIISTTHQQKFLDAYHNSINLVTNTNASQTQALAALYESYKLNIQPPDIVYLITGTDSLLNSRNFKAVVRQKLGTQINLIYTPAQQNYPAQPTSYLGYVALIARQSGGRVLPITQNSVATLSDALYSTIVEDALIMDDAVQVCTSGANFTFFVESVYNRVVIEVTGNSVSANGNLKMWDGVGIPLTYTAMFTDNAAFIVRASEFSAPGTWIAQVTSASGPCFIQVRAQSPIRVIPGFTSSPTADFVKDGPFTTYGTNPTTYMTFRVIDTGNVDQSTSLTTLSIFHTQYYQSWKPDDTKHTLDVPITPRDPANCASQFIATWQMENYNQQKFVVTGTDKNTMQFQRTFYFNLPDPTDTSTCIHGNRNSYGECNCDIKYKGNYCNERNCQNGGSSSYGICACVNGYYDDFCMTYIIDPGNATMELLEDGFLFE